MKNRPSNVASTSPRRTTAVIRFRVGSYPMGIEAGAVHEVYRDRNPPAKNRESLTVLSAHEIFGVPAGLETHLLVLNSGHTAFRVDRVERIVVTGSLSPLPRAFQGEERIWYQGFAVIDGVILPIVNPTAIEREAQARAPARASYRLTPAPPSAERVST